MKQSTIPKVLKPTKAMQKKIVNTNLKYKLKEQNSKRQRIVLSVTAGHIRGGHSFH